MTRRFRWGSCGSKECEEKISSEGMGVRTEKVRRGGTLYGDIDAFQDAVKIIACNRRHLLLLFLEQAYASSAFSTVPTTLWEAKSER